MSPLENQPIAVPSYTLQTPQGKLEMTRPVVMGIINVNSDSFFSGSRHSDLKTLLTTAASMLECGAGIIDVGGMSSRPGAKISDPKEEAEKMVPVIQAIRKEFPNCIISIDTVHSEVVHRAAEHGISLINDISAGSIDKELFAAVAKHKLPYVLMHMKGIPENMQTQSDYSSVTREVQDFLSRQIQICEDKGIEQVVIDPGFGFGKKIDHNYELLRNLQTFHKFQKPLMVGMSRKSMIWKKLNTNPAGAMNGSTVLHTLALMNGVHIIRTHDVRESVEAITLIELYKNAQA